jgi:hypothetical protein
MYAMSVSPRSLNILNRISPLLVSELGGPSFAAGGEETAQYKRKRDFSNNIKLGNDIYPVETVKGKKQVTLPWEKLAALKKSGDETVIERDLYRGLRGVITYRNHTLLAGEKLSLILKLLPILEPEGSLEREWKRKTSYYSGEKESLSRLIAELPLVLLPAAYKKRNHGKTGTVYSAEARQGRGSHPDRKELGFISLFTDFNGSYWFRCSRGFHTALNKSLASLEELIDEFEDDVDIGIKHEVNQIYRRLADILFYD